MSKFNTVHARTAVGSGPVRTEPGGSTRTHEGAPAFTRDPRSDLFLLAVTNMVGETTFYESAGTRDARFEGLVRHVAVEDPGWLLRFLRWLRATANMRSASLVAAAEMVHARTEAKKPSMPANEVPGFATDRGVERVVVDVVCQRADEPGELLAYWLSRYGRALPAAVKRGLGDAARRLYNEHGLLRYDTASHGVRFADVIDLVHPAPGGDWQSALFRHALDRRHGRVDAAELESRLDLPMVAAQQTLRRVAQEDPTVILDTAALRRAGMTWEDALSLAGPHVDKAALWSALAPAMGYMALLRNLRNFDEAGVSDQVAAQVAARIADPEQVERSRQFPFRFLSAYLHAPSLRWAYPLEQALQASVANIAPMPGRNLVLVDTSASMTSTALSGRSKVKPLHAAALFGAALAARGQDVDLFGFADGLFKHPVGRGASVLRVAEAMVKRAGEVGHGTQIAATLQAAYAGHDRVFLFSDMQTMPHVAAYDRDAPVYGVTNAVPDTVPLYGFNLGGYAPAVLDLTRPNRVELGGLTDATFRLIPLIEAGKRADWPF